MKASKCPICGADLIKVIGSNVSCTNGDCENYINNEHDSMFVDYYDYGYIQEDIKNFSYEVGKDYEEEYDEYLFFSDRKDYISRFEYREMNNFIEDYIFKDNKINVSKNYLDDDEIDNLENIERKYDLMDEGRNLEKESSKKALDFYSRYLHHRLFKKDYYIYKKLVKLETNPNKQLDLITSFFRSGIYCNRYHYLWFLKKLNQVSKKIDVADDLIDECLREYRNNGFKKRNLSDDIVPIAEKIALSREILRVRTDEEYSLRQYKYELSEEASELNTVNQYAYSTEILESLILYHGFKDVRIFERICNNYHKMGMYDEELKWIFGFFSKTRKYGNQYYWSFVERLNGLKVETNTFYHNELFFDENEYYLSKQDFKENEMVYCEITDYISLVKQKYSMILKGRELENINPKRAIEYYESILHHNLFKNDYYVYKSLVILYNQNGELEDALEMIISFLNSGIYCDRYNYLFFLFNLRKLSQTFIVEDYEINECLKSFKEKSFKNKHLENTPAPLSERLTCKNYELKIMPGEEFEIQQGLDALDLELQLFESCGMLAGMNEILKIMIIDYGIDELELYKQVCDNYNHLNDAESEMEIINIFLDRADGWNFKDRQWFEERLLELENLNPNSAPYDEPKIEIFYESNSNYLTYLDFKNNDSELTEFIDRAMLKFNLRRQGWRLEFGNYEDTIKYYNSLLNHYLFKQDYYIYRKLIIYYEKLNDYEMMWDTIKSFFASGINCTRYQYIWLLHKIENISKVMFISDEEVTQCLKNFKENGFKNKNVETYVLLAERLYKYSYSLRINSQEVFRRTQKKYELKEQSRQLEMNGVNEQATEILRNLIENGCNRSPKDYMRLCHMYRRSGDLENELEIINLFLSKNYNYSRNWFEKRLEEVNELIEKKSNDDV